MKATALSARLVTLVGLLSASASSGAAEPLPIALVNMDRLFKTHQPLLDQLEPLKTEAKDLDAKVQLRQAELEAVAAKLRSAQPGSPEFQRLQQEGVKLQNELRQFVETERQALQKKEAAVYLEFYRQVEAEVNKYAKAHGIKLVLRQQDSSLDENQPLAEVLKTLSRGVIYEEGLDITDEIVKGLNAASRP
jgi:Skp family chaperone for outer membrane proteins